MLTRNLKPQFQCRCLARNYLFPPEDCDSCPEEILSLSLLIPLLFRTLPLFFSDVGVYIYIEASGKSPGASARLSFENVTGKQCLTFFYNMWGSDIGELKVLVNDTVVMSVVGEQGWDWKMAQVQLNGTQNKVSHN